MKANELRIGNIVIQGEIVRIQESSARVKYELDGQDRLSYVDYDILEPIPLTEEWLIKFDLMLDTKSDEIVRYSMIRFPDFTVILQNNEQGQVEFNGYHICYVNFVHQFQNLYFALTGKELTIKE